MCVQATRIRVYTTTRSYESQFGVCVYPRLALLHFIRYIICVAGSLQPAYDSTDYIFIIYEYALTYIINDQIIHSQVLWSLITLLLVVNTSCDINFGFNNCESQNTIIHLIRVFSSFVCRLGTRFCQPPCQQLLACQYLLAQVFVTGTR